MTGFREGNKLSAGMSDLNDLTPPPQLQMSKSNSAMPGMPASSMAARPAKSAQNEALTRSCASQQLGDSLSSPIRSEGPTAAMRDIKHYRIGQGLG